MRRCLFFFVVCLTVLSVGCDSRPTFDPGTPCALNTECGSRYVCRLGYCRIECRENRDCPVGLICLQDEAGLGACQLEEEQSCTLTSECPEPLVCSQQQCTNACNDSRDCPPGSECVNDGTTNGCVDTSPTECIYDSECAAPLVCGLDNRCRAECLEDRDCKIDERCDTTGGPGVCFRQPFYTFGLERLVVGGDFSCILSTADTAYCWGADVQGQLGTGAPAADDPNPAAVSLNVRRLAAGQYHALALLRTPAQLWAWGQNDPAALGAPVGTTYSCGAMTGLSYSCSPTSVGSVDAGQIVDLSAGWGFSCALLTTGVVCWGDNLFGQLTLPASAATSTPTAVALSGVPSHITSGYDHTCARMPDGTVECWGRNQFGQSVPAGADPVAPTKVPGVTDVVEVVAGSGHTCARQASGSVLCWGDRFYGQLGDGTASATPPSAPVTALVTGAVELMAGFAHTCARLSDGTMSCWGNNGNGQLALDQAMTTSPSPLQVETAPGTPLADVLAMGGGTGHTCAMTLGGLNCWGANNLGQLGPGCAASNCITPTLVPIP